MPKSKNSDEPNFFPKKYAKALEGRGFMEEADALDAEGLKKKILEAEGALVEMEREFEANPKINELKEMMKEVNGPYKETKNYQTAKIKYCMHVLENKGTSVSDSDSE